MRLHRVSAALVAGSAAGAYTCNQRLADSAAISAGSAAAVSISNRVSDYEVSAAPGAGSAAAESHNNSVFMAHVIQQVSSMILAIMALLSRCA